jgi:hypothetical protein
MSSRSKPRLPSPWAEFLEALDAALPEEVKLNCIGGFVVSLFYGLPRPTRDVDYFSAVPAHRINDLQALAGRDSALAKKHKLYLQYFSSHNMPEWGDRFFVPVRVSLHIVLAAQVADGDLKDIYFGDNLRKLPGMDYPVGELFANLDVPSGSPYACSPSEYEFRCNSIIPSVQANCAFRATCVREFERFPPAV